MTRHLKHRTKEEKTELLARYKALKNTGLSHVKSARELGVAPPTIHHWLKNGIEKSQNAHDFPIVSAAAVRPYAKKVKPSGKVIVIATDISSLSSVLSNL